MEIGVNKVMTIGGRTSTLERQMRRLLKKAGENQITMDASDVPSYIVCRICKREVELANSYTVNIDRMEEEPRIRGPICSLCTEHIVYQEHIWSKGCGNTSNVHTTQNKENERIYDERSTTG